MNINWNEKIIIVIIISILTITLLTTYAFFRTSNTTENQKIEATSASMTLTFSDGNSGLNEKLNFGESVTKTFSIENSGTLDAIARINWNDLINTYLDGSLTYTLSFSESQDGNYTELIKDKNVPRSNTPSTIELANSLKIPSKKTYYYKLIISLNFKDFDQTADLSATLSTNFLLTEGTDPGLETTLKILKVEPLKKEVNFNYTSPLPTFKDNGFTSPPVTSGSFAGCSNTNYYQYASSYTFDPHTGLYTLVNPTRGIYNDIYSRFANKYINDRAYYIQKELTSIKKYTNATSCNYTYQTSIPPTITSYASDSGVYQTEDDTGISYYYRGDIKNNYLVFGKWSKDTYRGYKNASSTEEYQDFGSLELCQNDETYKTNCSISPIAGKNMYWRIIRINGNGSIRVIYDGTEPHENGEQNRDRIMFNKVQWNTLSNDIKYTGYMYGGQNGQASTSIEEAQTNETSSPIKTLLESWYIQNIEVSDDDKYISDEIFCNNRQLNSGRGYGQSGDFIALKNLFRDEEKTPNLKCPNENDRFTTSKNNGNGNLNKPIGLITADELSFLGMRKMVANEKSYLYKGYYYWTMTPYNNNAMSILTSNGMLYYISIKDTGVGVAAVINLTPDYVTNLIGDGTPTNPYRLPNVILP